MAFPEDRLSSVPVLDDYLPPDGIGRSLDEDYEQGPIGLGDTSSGSSFQQWHMTYSDPDFTFTPADVGAPFSSTTLPNWPGGGVPNVTECSFAFDGSGNITITYRASNIVSLYFFNTLSGMYETIASVENALSAMVCFDDKRVTQSQLSDVLVVYTKQVAAQFILHYRRQRDRYLTEFDLLLPSHRYIWKLGMHEGLRVQITTIDSDTPVP